MVLTSALGIRVISLPYLLQRVGYIGAYLSYKFNLSTSLYLSQTFKQVYQTSCWCVKYCLMSSKQFRLIKPHLLWRWCLFRPVYQLHKVTMVFWYPSLYELQHVKANRLTFAPNEDSNQPAHPRSLIWVFIRAVWSVFVVRIKKLDILGYPICA